MTDYAKLRRDWTERTLAPHEAKEAPRKRVPNLAGHADAAAALRPRRPRAARLRPGRATSASRASRPFTRGVQPNMYRGRLWTMRQYAGFGTARRVERALPLPARAGADGL